MIFLYLFGQDFYHEGIWILSKWLHASVERMEWLLILHFVDMILQVDWEACAKSCSQGLCLVLLINAAPHNEFWRASSLSMLWHNVRRTSVSYSFRVLKNQA